MPTIHLKGHFDGHAIQLDEPLELPRGVPLQVTVTSVATPTQGSSQDAISTSRDALVEPLSAVRLAEIDAWIRDLSTLATDISDEAGACLQSAVAEIRRQARDLARHGAETLP